MLRFIFLGISALVVGPAGLVVLLVAVPAGLIDLLVVASFLIPARTRKRERPHLGVHP